MRPDPERARLAAEALARARADAWARGERPGTASRQPGRAPEPSERTGLTPDGTASPGWLARTRRDDPQPLTAAVGGLMSARGWRERAAVGAVFGHWSDIVGPQLALHTKPVSFEAGELTVSADSDAWGTQVRLMAPQLLKRLGEELGHGTVRHIRVKGPAGPPRSPGRLRVRLAPDWGLREDNGLFRRFNKQLISLWREPPPPASPAAAEQPDSGRDTYREGGPECR